MTRIVRTTPRKPSSTPIPNGTRDPNFPECILIPVKDIADDKRFPRISARIIEGTYIRFDTDRRKVRSFVTVIPSMMDAKGLHVAWDMCGRCHDYFRHCKCGDGIYHCASIAHIKSRAVEELGGSPHEAGRFYDPFNLAIKHRRGTGMRSASVAWTPPARKEIEAAPSKRTKRSVVSSVHKARSTTKVDTSDIDAIDLSKVAKDAESQVKAMTDKIASPRKRVFRRRPKV